MSCQDGKFWSGGGVSSGIDLALAFVSSVSGRGVAGKVQLMIEYFPPQVGLGWILEKC